MRQTMILALIAFMVTLAVVVGHRLSSEAMAVVVGIVLGVLASIPTSLALLVIIRRQTASQPRRQRQPKQQNSQLPYPPVIVINPGAGAQDRQMSPFLDPPGSQPAGYLPRDFRIVGEEDEEDEW